MAADGPVLRPLPYDIDAEKAVIGALVIDRDAIIKVASWLRPGHFYQETNAWMYEAIYDLYRRRTPPDMITICDELRQRGRLDPLGGLQTILHAWAIPTMTHVHLEYYAEIVVRLAKDRRRVSIAGELAGLSYRDDLSTEAKAQEERRLIRLLNDDTPDSWVSLYDVWARNVDQIEARQRGEIPPGIPTGFATLTAHTQGWQAGDLVLLGARTSRGKSALALHFAAAAAEAQYSVGVVSLEAKAAAAGLRLLARQSAVNLATLRSGALGAHDWEKVNEALGEGSAMARRVHFLDSPTQTVAKIAAYVDQLRASDKGCDLLIVDYLQLLRGHGSNRESEVAGISRDLKLLGMDAGIPVIALAQLSRAAIGAEVPGLHHFRESGAQEQDANIALLLHRPDEDTPQEVHLILAKQREGIADVAIRLEWDGGHQRFKELDA